MFTVVFVTFPLARPLMSEGSGFTDTLAQYGPPIYTGGKSSTLYNTFAAMPSVHFAWAAAFGVLFFRWGPRWQKDLGVVYPIATLYAMTITGMHFLSDAVAGLLMMLMAFAIYEAVLRRATWRFRWNGHPSPQAGRGWGNATASPRSARPGGLSYHANLEEQH